jgi:hypothetical protein
MADRLMHDCAYAASFHIVEIFAPLLGEEEQTDGFREVYSRLIAALECYEVHREREQHRLRPSQN